ncbi:MAG: hypothetical protein QXW32_06280 [Nitrososphaerales archaeon]
METSNSQTTASWQIEVPLANRFMITHLSKGLAALMIACFLIFGTVLAVANGLEGLIQGLMVTLGMGLFFILVSILTLFVILRNRYTLMFKIGDDGVVMESRVDRAHKIHRLALILGLLARNPAATGAGLSGIVSERVEVPWKTIRSFKSYPDKRAVKVNRRFLPALYIYCKEDNFNKVVEIFKNKQIIEQSKNK